MTQDEDLDGLIRQRIRGLRAARGWSLDDLASRCYLSPSTLSRIETGHRRIALDQLVPIARALGTTLDQLVESADDEDVVIRPHRDVVRGMTTWLLSREPGPHGVTVAKMRVTRPEPGRGTGELRVHPGKDWFTVLSGTIVLVLGERTIVVEGRPGRGVLHDDPARVRRPRRARGGPVHPRPRRAALSPAPLPVGGDAGTVSRERAARRRRPG